MVIIDDFIPKSFQQDLEDLFLGLSFPWKYTPNTYGSTSATSKNMIKETPQFVHLLFNNPTYVSEFFPYVRPLLYFSELEYKEIMRMKVNYLHKDENFTQQNYHTPHRDSSKDEECKTILYYVNDSDGDTVFLDSNDKIIKRISPKKGRALIFDSSLYHASTSPTKSDNRIVINTVLKL